MSAIPAYCPNPETATCMPVLLARGLHTWRAEDICTGWPCGGESVVSQKQDALHAKDYRHLGEGRSVEAKQIKETAGFLRRFRF